ncbi:serine protease [Streptomyces pluripotens]|uniref:Serine protease n=1 Tax=Streptomyces pluripotens TaxID=1355015 RepID=A0A221P4F5_9ACTN|nr:S8 family serine peptidase [Streptomyces pluripotens]ARP72903.1 hypothetical protein LK06_026370 [Streptomyces pluripotens]ASN27153.1 serine protease [Streptomyces pluripotens]
MTRTSGESRLPRAAVRAAALLTAAAIPMLAAVPASGLDIRGSEWPLNRGHLAADRIWPTSRGKGVTVAVVDTGVQANHPDLVGRVLPGADFTGDTADGRTDTATVSHGTAIAGIIAGTGASHDGRGMTGLAPQARILPVRVSEQGVVASQLLADGITYAADHQAKVINVSIGSSIDYPAVRAAVAHAQARGALVVASAGNDGTSGNPIQYPAALPGVVAVSGVDSKGGFWPHSEHGPDIALAAPAVGIYSTNDQGEYVKADGTSYAAAYVSATAALLWARRPELTAGQVVSLLINTAQRRTSEARDQRYGYGIVDPRRALAAAAPTAVSNPLMTAPPAADPSGGVASAVWPASAAVGAVMLLAAAYALRRRRTPQN